MRRHARWWGTVALYSQVVVLVVWCLLPYYWLIATAFRPTDQTFETTLWPSSPTWENVVTAFSTERGNRFGLALFNSFFVGAVVTVLALTVGVFAAYALARFRFRGKALVLGLVLGASMFPGVALVTPLFELFTAWGWVGQYQALIIPQVSFALPLAIYTLVSFFQQLPWSLEDAARIDGCTRFQAFGRVMAPLAAPGLLTTAILAFIASWNEFLIASQLSSENTQTVTVAIASFAGALPQQEPYTAIMAAGMIVTVPLVLVVLILQRRIVSGLTAGGVK